MLLAIADDNYPFSIFWYIIYTFGDNKVLIYMDLNLTDVCNHSTGRLKYLASGFLVVVLISLCCYTFGNEGELINFS